MDYEEIYSVETLERKVKHLFPLERQHEVWAILRQYGHESHHREKTRVQIDMLKLSRGSIEKLRQQLNIAVCDYRDIMAPAEYPNQLKADTWKLSELEKQQLIEKDLKQYLAWLNEDL